LSRKRRNASPEVVQRPPVAEPHPPAAGWRWPALVAAVTLVVFLPTLQAGFVSWDDDKNFIANQAWRGLGADQLRWMWTTFHLGTWIPLSWMSLGLDFTIWGLRPAGFHFTNIALQALNAALCFALARRLLFADRAARGVGSTDANTTSALNVGAGFAALAFAIHPLRVESVAWITERRDLLSGAFYLASLLCYLRFTDGRNPRRNYGLAVVLALLSLLAKGTAVTLPVALLILNVWPLRRMGGTAGWISASARRVWVDLLPFILLAGVFTAVVFVALQPVEQLSVAGKFAVSAYSLQFYLVKTLAPLGLSPLRAMPATVDPLGAVYLLSAALVVILGIVAWRLRRSQPGITASIVAFAAILFPLLGVHQGGPQIVADRNTYNASIALAILAGGLLSALAMRRLRAAMGVGAVAVGALAILTVRQSRVWQDSESLWMRVVAVEPDSPFGHNNLGNIRIRQGRADEALDHYSRAIRFRPNYAEAHTNLGVALATTGRLNDAIAEYRKALELRPSDDEALNNWGVALARIGDTPGAIERYSAAVTANPANADAHVNWGNALVRLGRHAEAIPHYRDALTYRPDHAEAHHNWGVALAQQGAFAEAATHFEQALLLVPAHVQARDYLARVRELQKSPR
jgi:Flp pilus assembly protein TadD